MDEPITLKDHLTKIASKGGQSRSEAKRAAVRENQKKAVAARMAKRRLGGK